jgi:hypothetical protein
MKRRSAPTEAVERNGGRAGAAGGGGAWSIGPGGRSAEDEQLLRAVAERVVRMGLGAAAMFFLESIKPLSFLGSQALVFFEPFVRAFLTTAHYQRFASLIERRDNLEFLIREIEASEESNARAQKEARQAALRRAGRERMVPERRGLWDRIRRVRRKPGDG